MLIESVAIESQLIAVFGSGKHKKKLVSCEKCCEKRLVNFWAFPKFCRSCSGGISSSKAKRLKTGKFKPCAHCSSEYWEYKYQNNSSKFCSAVCANDHKRKYPIETKKCKHCLKEFKASEKPFSNTPNNFCSLVCRNDSYAKNAIKYGVKDHRPRWRTRRNKFILSGNDFCSLCGTRPKRIDVHHVIPYRVNKSDNEDNLISLCHKCHMSAEKISDKIARLPENQRSIAAAIFMADAQDYWLLHKAKYA